MIDEILFSEIKLKKMRDDADNNKYKKYIITAEKKLIQQCYFDYQKQVRELA